MVSFYLFHIFLSSERALSDLCPSNVLLRTYANSLYSKLLRYISVQPLFLCHLYLEYLRYFFFSLSIVSFGNKAKRGRKCLSFSTKPSPLSALFYSTPYTYMQNSCPSILLKFFKNSRNFIKFYSNRIKRGTTFLNMLQLCNIFFVLWYPNFIRTSKSSDKW